ncbi:hypothetical protein DQ384_21780 [Sphaerisporangium album]|uniref:Uncharacterized protein n=1 Tax=Sphaerisporangium album TaxID=509200 RepID=A0A367FF31_9ACTN|nr:hypothetical protein DQ384_21780 [Sphaerisporangium album]
MEVEAVQWAGDNAAELISFTGFRFRTVAAGAAHGDGTDVTAEVLDVLHSTWVGIKTGQWVIRGVRGEFYPIDGDVLRETYEPVASL